MKRFLLLMLLPLGIVACSDDPCVSAKPDPIEDVEVVIHQGDLLLDASSPFAKRVGEDLVVDVPDWHVVVGGNLLIDASQINTVIFMVPPVVLSHDGVGGSIRFLASTDHWQLTGVSLRSDCPTDECGPDQPITLQDMRVPKMKLTGEEFIPFWDSVQQLNRTQAPRDVCDPIQ